MHTTAQRRIFLAALLMGVPASACESGGAGGGAATDSGGTEGGGTDSGGTHGDTDGLDPDRPFEPPTTQTALYKVKTFLIGIAPTAEEYASYAADPGVLPGLIDSWMARPEFEPRAKEMLSFMFQQRAASDDIGLMMREQNTDILQQREGRGGVDLEGPMRESWALTAWDIINEDRSFTDVATTRTFYMNVPLMMAMAYVDSTPRDDTNAYVNGFSWLETQHPNLEVRYTQTEQIPFSASIDPLSADYGVFTIGEPDGSAAGSSACDGLNDTFTGRSAIEEVYKYMMGAPFRTTCWSWNGAMANVFTEPGDLEMREVTVRVAGPTEDRTTFWDLDTLRTTDELVLGTDYVGFFGTMGFLGQWTTNSANEHRVTANQTLIVALGRSFDPGDFDAPIDEIDVDEAHAAPGTVCYSCHVTLDPLRDFFRQSYTYWGSARIDGMGDNEAVPDVATFTVDGSDPVEGFGVGDLGNAIAGSDRFAYAWAEKMCGLANAGMCNADDPELVAVAEAFAASGHNFKVLLRELLSSPVVTYQERTETWEDHGATVGAALQDDFCRRVQNRVGIHDACAILDELDAQPDDRDQILGYANVLSRLGYARGAVEPSQPITPTLFATAGAESVCEALASRFISSGGGGSPIELPFDPASREDAVDFFLTGVMGVWRDDPRAADLRAVLQAHWDEVLGAGQDEETAMQSTFVLACSAPQTSSLGL